MTRPLGWVYFFKREGKITDVGKDVKKVEPSDSTGKNVKWVSHCGNHSGRSSKHETELLHTLAISKS